MQPATIYWKAWLKRVSPIFKEVKGLSSSKRKHVLFLMVVDFYQNQGIYLRKKTAGSCNFYMNIYIYIQIYRFQVLNVAALLSGKTVSLKLHDGCHLSKEVISLSISGIPLFRCGTKMSFRPLKKYWALPKHCNNGLFNFRLSVLRSELWTVPASCVLRSKLLKINNTNDKPAKHNGCIGTFECNTRMLTRPSEGHDTQHWSCGLYLIL